MNAGEVESVRPAPSDNESALMQVRLLGLASIALISATTLVIREAVQLTQQNAHSGSVESAVVGIEVIATTKDGAAQQVRRGNGLIIRCDGFILAPSFLFSRTVTVGGQTEPAGEQRITVIVHPGTPHEKRLPGRNPRFTPREVGYAAFKLEDFHGMCAGTLLPDDLKPGTQVHLVFSRYDLPSRRFLPVERRSLAAGQVTADSEKAAPGVVPFLDPMPGVPAGASVVGQTSFAIGMCTTQGQGGPADFTSTEVLHLATNCVTPKSSVRADEAEMVAVQGGPVTLNLAILGAQPDMEATIQACMPPFQIDKFEVTNEEYLAYWLTLPEEERRSLGFRSNYYPWTWAPWPASPPFPSDIARHPVLGVALAGARGYARWKGKRLPTPYEWYLAAIGPRGELGPPDWIGRFLGDKKQAWDRIKGLHIQQLQARRDLQQEGIFVQGPYRLPWIAATQFVLEPAAWSRQTITFALNTLWATWKDPFYVRTVGLREYDKGHSGMQDALLNASELVAPYPGPPVLGNPRYFEVQWLPPKQNLLQDPWLPAQIEAITDDRPLQPLSRLYRRLFHGPTPEDLVLWSNLNETVQMLRPNSGWSLILSGDSRTSATMKPPERNPYRTLAQPSGLKLWQEMPPHTKREMGRDAPLQGPGERGGPGPSMHYYLPVGFRCAR